jgi:hypothetical protein
MSENMPSPGDIVFASDGKECGAVKEVRGGYFHVDAPMRRDYWLSRAYIASCGSGRVDLNIDKDEVDEHGLSQPGLEPEQDLDRAGIGDSVINENEALATRERMERELARQRGGLDSGLH